MPKLAGMMSTNIANNLVHAPTINGTMNGGDGDAAHEMVKGVSHALDHARPDTFRKSHRQQLSEANMHLQRSG